MSVTGWIAVALLVPAVCWGLVWFVWALRVAVSRRRDAGADEAALRRRLTWCRGRGIEVVTVHTELVDLPADEVRRVARACGYRLAGFEDARGPLRRRLGVFVQSEGEIARVLAGHRERAPEAEVGPGARLRRRLRRQPSVSTVDFAQR